METTVIKISKLKSNSGQIEGLPKNPRMLKDERYEKLKQSLIDEPEMLELRECIVYPFEKTFIVICGNMRLKVCEELGYKELPCKVLPASTTLDKLKAYTIKDNISYGDHDFDLLRDEWDNEQLDKWGVEVPIFEQSEENIDISDKVKSQYKIEIICKDEKEQELTYNKFIEEGYECRILSF